MKVLWLALWLSGKGGESAEVDGSFHRIVENDLQNLAGKAKLDLRAGDVAFWS